jgi:hypothetical protein
MLEKNIPAIIMLLRADSKLLEPAMKIFAFAKNLPTDPDVKLDNKTVAAAVKLARTVASRTSSRRLRIDANKAADVLESSRARTAHDLLMHLATNEPTRRRFRAHS